MILRLRSRDGLERVSVADSATVGDLKRAIAQNLGVPVEEQRLSKDQKLLLSKEPELFQDMSADFVPLESLGINNGSFLFWRYERERSIPGPAVVIPAGTYGKKMTVEDMIAKQTRIERQEKPIVSTVSFDRRAANIFQVSSSLVASCPFPPNAYFFAFQSTPAICEGKFGFQHKTWGIYVWIYRGKWERYGGIHL